MISQYEMLASALDTKFLRHCNVKSVILYKDSMYIIGDYIEGKVEFYSDMNISTPILMPIGKDYSNSQDLNDDIKCKLDNIDKRYSVFCDSLVYINKADTLNFISSQYDSIAKLNKMRGILNSDSFIFAPVKKSTSVKKSVYKINEVGMLKNIRMNNSQVKFRLLQFVSILKINFLQNILKIEVHETLNFIRVSCTLPNRTRIKFLVVEH